MKINEPTPEMAAWHARARLVRDVTAGEHQIKLGREEYLPRFRAKQSDEEYDRFLKSTSFFPATARTAQGRRGLMFARNVVLNGTALDPIKNVLTPHGDDWRSVAEHIVYDTFQTNYTGLLVDHPAAPDGVELNADNALMEGFRPFLHVFRLECILEATRGLVRNQQKFVRIRILESEDRVLELLLLNGTYVQRVHKREGGQWKVEQRTPGKDGQPLTEIPFEIVSDNKAALPQPSVLEDVARLNIAHYIAQGRINALQVFGSGLVPILKGVQPEKRIVDGQETLIAPELQFGSNGQYLLLPNPESDFGFLEPRGYMAADLRQSKKDLEDQMAACASRMLEPPAVAPEAPENSARRSQAEDSTNASLAQTYAARISRAFSRMAWWMTPGDAAFTGEEVTLTLNTDYKTRGMTAQDRTVAMAELQAGIRSWEDWFYERRDAGLVNSSLTPEEEKARIEADNVDRPTVETL
jgi:hypothetical protein